MATIICISVPTAAAQDAARRPLRMMDAEAETAPPPRDPVGRRAMPRSSLAPSPAPPANSPIVTLPAGWSTRDIGAAAAGTAAHAAGQFTVTGPGPDIWGTADGFRFVYRSLTGDGQIVARVESLQMIEAWSKAGLMMRESLNPGSRHASILVSAGNGLAFQRRPRIGGPSSHTPGGPGAAPQFLKLVRSGTTFHAYRSDDGVSWTHVGSDTLPMASTIHVGLVVSSHHEDVPAVATFTHAAVTAGAASTPAPPPAAPPPAAPSGTRLRLLHWNIQHGMGTDRKYDLDRLATWMADMRPDVISLNEVERFSSSWGNENQPEILASLLAQKTGRRWYVHFAQRSGQWSANGQGNVILSRFPLTHTDSLKLSCNRSAGLAGIVVNGRTINIVSTHLDLNDGCRTTQVSQILAWFRYYPEARIIAGDWNAQASSSHVSAVTQTYHDAWARAASAGTAVDYPGNSRFGATRNTRIDYVFYSKLASALVLRSAQVYDTRDARGYMPSDHKPLVVTFEVR